VSVTRTSNPRRIIRRITEIWSELDYAQRRLLEITTGTSGLTRRSKDHQGRD
jgi:hypothetical protein